MPEVKVIRPEPVPVEVTITMTEREAKALYALVGSLGFFVMREVFKSALPDAQKALEESGATPTNADGDLLTLYHALRRAGINLA
jgi:hypothetical protein